MSQRDLSTEGLKREIQFTCKLKRADITGSKSPRNARLSSRIRPVVDSATVVVDRRLRQEVQAVASCAMQQGSALKWRRPNSGCKGMVEGLDSDVKGAVFQSVSKSLAYANQGVDDSAAQPSQMTGGRGCSAESGRSRRQSTAGAG